MQPKTCRQKKYVLHLQSKGQVRLLQSRSDLKQLVSEVYI